MPESDHSNDPVSIEELKEIMDDDMELIQDCFAEFVREWPLAYVDIKGAILEKNPGKLDESAHRLKGTLRYLAAEPAVEAAHALESAGKGNDMSGIDDKLSSLKNECQKLLDYIKGFN